MTDPTRIRELLERTEDAFVHTTGRPDFEPLLDNSPGADDGKVQIQKACRLLELAWEIDEVGEYYGAILEHSFIAIEHTFQGYLLAMTGVEERELRDHTSPYQFGKGQIPLDDDVIDRVEAIYHGRRTDHYYGTTVTTKTQAESLRALATAIHDHVVGFDHDLETFCLCSD